jgi:hypothetical protein
MAKVLVSKEGYVSIRESKGYDDKDDIPSNVNVKVLSKGYSDIPRATRTIGIAYPQYTRRLLLEGKLFGIKVATKGGSKWFIDNGSIEAYKYATSGAGKVRNYTLKIAKADEKAVRKLLTDSGLGYSLTIAFKTKG